MDIGPVQMAVVTFISSYPRTKRIESVSIKIEVLNIMNRKFKMIKTIHLYLLRAQVICLMFVIMLRPSFNIYAQPGDIKFKHLSIEQGLSQSFAFCIVQDNNGFIWIGTETGLNKYDGYTFTVYESDVDNLNSLSNSYVTSICKDDYGIFWVGTEKGLNRFDPGKRSIYKIFTRF